MFTIYLEEGIRHITDLNGYDHIAFLFALLAGYTYKDLRKIIILVTAFTVGHTITLALSSLDKILIDSSLIEFLIPVTIFITALYHFFTAKKEDNLTVIYALAFFFGLIHGAGFSNYFKSLMGKSTSVFAPLLGFNIGVEIGQLIIVLIILLISYVVINLLKLKQQSWKLFLSTVAVVISIKLMIDTWPF